MSEEQKVIDDTTGALVQVLNTTKDSMEKIMVVCRYLSLRVERLEQLTGFGSYLPDEPSEEELNG